LFEIDGSAIISVDDFSTPLGALPQGGRREGLKHSHIVMIALVLDSAETQRCHPPISKIARLEMGDAKLGAADLFIVARVFVAVAVTRIDIKPFQLRKRYEGIRKIA
jgi:hypothetical protein